MLKIHTLPLGLYQTNCYIVHKEGSSQCVVIDPGYEANTILNRTALLGLEIQAILLTHGHFDHVGAVRQIAADTDCQVYLHENELSLPTAMTDGPLYYTDLYDEEGLLSIAGMDIKVLHTPGHTPGSVCLIIDNAMFSGDTLFAGSMGRCDFPGSNIFDMRKSLKKLRDLPGDYRVLPGHAEDSTLEYERKTNPYLR
jgi:glyoxylase-like metal-dependent hydrolase (beta-lactamase superfamily II)